MWLTLEEESCLSSDEVARLRYHAAACARLEYSAAERRRKKALQRWKAAKRAARELEKQHP
jgi:hypothetical protein